MAPEKASLHPQKSLPEAHTPFPFDQHQKDIRKLLQTIVILAGMDLNCVHEPYVPGGYNEIRVTNTPKGTTGTQASLNLRLPRLTAEPSVDTPALQFFANFKNSGGDYRLLTSMEIVNGLTLSGNPASLNGSLSIGAQSNIPLSTAPTKSTTLPTFYAAPFISPILSIPLSDPKTSLGFSSVLCIPYIGTEIAWNPWPKEPREESTSPVAISSLAGVNISLSSPRLRIGGGLNIPIPGNPQNWSFYNFLRGYY